MKRNLALLVLIVFSITAMALMPALANQQDLKPADAAGNTDKFLRMGNSAIPGRYIVVLDVDAAGRTGDLFTAARITSDLTNAYGRVCTNIYAYALNGFSAEIGRAH